MSRIPAPVITPTAADVKPCEGRAELFESTAPIDHAYARVHCLGSKTTAACPFVGWCRKEREEFQASDYRGGLHGTWHGVLFVDGRVTKRVAR